MNDYTKYHIQRIADNLNSYTKFELELMLNGITKRSENLQENNENFQKSLEITSYIRLGHIIAKRIQDIEEWMYYDEYLYCK